MMRKRVIVSLMSILVVAMLMGGGSFAYFSDTETSTSNTIQAAVWDFTENPIDPPEFPLLIENAKPCEEYQAIVAVNSLVSHELPIWLRVTNIVTDDGINSEPEEAAGGVGVYDIDNRISFDLGLDTDLDGQVDEVLIAFERNIKLGDVEGYYIPLGAWGDHQTINVHLSFHLQSDTPNQYQGDRCTFDYEFFSTSGPAPSPQFELP
jgi:predicted ribosomally synthesized peptide with SipW-like signal peptide